jgi:hypothetical protein
MNKLLAAVSTVVLLTVGLGTTSEAATAPPKGAVTWAKGSRRVASILPPVDGGPRPCLLNLKKIDINDPMAGGATATVHRAPRSFKPNDKLRFRIDGKIVNAANKVPKAFDLPGKVHFKTANLPKRYFGGVVVHFDMYNSIPGDKVRPMKMRSVFTFRLWKVRPGPDLLVWKQVYRSPLETQCVKKAPIA